MSGKILVVDDHATNRLILSAALKKDFYQVFEAIDGCDCIEKANAILPDLILLDIDMPKIDGIEACRRLKSNPKTRNIPVVMVTTSNNQTERNLGLEVGADDFLTKPFDQRVLFARVKNLLRVKILLDELEMRNSTADKLQIDGGNAGAHLASSRSHLLIISDDDAHASQSKAQLIQTGKYNVNIENTEAHAMEVLLEQDYDAFIISEHLADNGVGLRLVAHIRAHWAKRNTAVIFISKSGLEAGLRSLDLGANDYLIEPFDGQELLMRLKTQLNRKHYADRLRATVEEQLRLSIIDPLTDLHNRRYFDLYLPRIIARAAEVGSSFAIMMLDLDKFKFLNDSFGHDFGDQVLISVAAQLRDNLRAIDLICRFGGEEFVIITPNVDLKLAQEISERLRSSIEDIVFTSAKGETINVTTSIGVSLVKPSESNIPHILKQSDQALYKAKSSGRNQVSFFEM